MEARSQLCANHFGQHAVSMPDLIRHPGKIEKKKAISAAFPELSCRFAKETSMSKTEMLSDIDFLDITVRSETLSNVPGAPVQIQLGVVPAYALTLA